MERLSGIVILALVLLGLVSDTNPHDVLKAINELRSQRAAEARAAGKSLDLAALNAEVQAKVQEAIKNVDVASVNARDAYAWAQLFSMAGKHKEVCGLCVKFLTTNPDAEQKYAAQTLMLSACNALGEADMLLETLSQTQPPSIAASQSLARTVLGSYAATIAKAKGVEAALAAIGEVERKTLFESPEDYAKRLLPEVKARQAGNKDNKPKDDATLMAELVAAGRMANDSLRLQFAQKRAELLDSAGRRQEAVRVLDEFIATLDEDSTTKRRARTVKNQLLIVGSVAPMLEVERKIGEFEALKAWNGKVILVKFFAHW